MNYARFFAPLALQAASQGLTYPLVAMVASRGPGGPLNLAGLAQANTVMFALGTLGFGLITTGMVHGRTREGFRRFQVLSLRIGLIVVAIQALLCLPPIAHLLFGRVIGLPPAIEAPATLTLGASLALQFLFFLRIPFQVAMYNALASARASTATMMRIVVTAALAPLFCLAGWVGPLWAVVCLTLPVALEVVVSAMLARPFIAAMSPATTPPATKAEMFWFNLPISIGGYLLSLSAIVLGAFVARAPHPEQMLPVYYLALGLATPVAYGATRVQEVVLAFGTPSTADRRTLHFAFSAGMVMGLLPLPMLIPGLAELYYVKIQNLAAADLPLLRVTALTLVAYPLSVAVRAQGEGLAGLSRKPLTVIAGQAVFLATAALAGGIFLVVGLPGNLIGPVGLVLGNIASTVTLRLLLVWSGKSDQPTPPTITATG